MDRISPKYAVNDILDFKAIAGHELIHAYKHLHIQNNTLPLYSQLRNNGSIAQLNRASDYGSEG